jgi:hypothetical protein
VLAEHATNGRKREEWNGETRISAREYRDIQEFYFNCYLKAFSGVLLQYKKLVESMQTKSNDSSSSSKKSGRISELFNREEHEV